LHSMVKMVSSDEPSLFSNPIYWLWGLMVVAGLFAIVRSGFDPNVPMSRTSRIIRVVGGSIWAVIILLGIAMRIYDAMR